MSTTQTAVTPTTPAQATALISQSVPVGGDPRIIAGITSVLQRLLNLASIAARLVTGGSIGDGTGGSMVFQNAAIFQKDMSCAGNLQASGPFYATFGPSRIGRNIELDVTVGTGTIAPAGTSTPMGIQYGRFFWTNTNITGGSANAQYTIDDTNCDDSDEFEVLLANGVGGILTILKPGGATIAVLGGNSPQRPYARFRRIDGVWHWIPGTIAP